MSELGSLLRLEYGQALPAGIRTNHGFPVFGSNGEVGRHSKYLVQGPGIVVGRKGSVGAVTWSNESFWPIDTTYWVSCSEENKRWLYWLLAWLPLHRLDSSTGVPGLNRNDVYALKVHEPEQNEKAKLNQVLDTLDTVIQQTEGIVKKLKQVKQGLLHDLLTRGLDVNGELRPSHMQAPHLYKESSLGWIPNDWTLRTVASLGEIRSGSTPSRGKADRYFHSQGTPWVKTLDLNEDVIRKTDECITAAALRETSCSVLPADAVLIAMYGGWEQIGRTAMLGVPAATNQALSTVTISDPGVVPEYVLRALQHGRPRWKRVAASTRKDPNITKVDVETFELPMPSTRDEQLAIVTRYRALLAKLAVEQLELRKRQEEKAGVMNDLLTGRVRVTSLLVQ